MNAEAGEAFTKAIDAMAIILPAMLEWAETRLEGSERDEALFHIERITTDFRTLMTAVSDWTGVMNR